MIEQRNDYGFPLLLVALCESLDMMDDLNRQYAGRPSLKLERAQAYAADVRARRGMVVRKGVYLDLIK